MGVDVSSNAGFGVYIDKFPKDYDSENEDASEYLDIILRGTNYSYLIDGSYYDNDDLNFAIIVSNVTDEIDKKNGFSFLDSVSDELEDFLKEKGFTYRGTPNIVCTELWH